MKTIILFLFAALFFQTGMAQAYHSYFGKEVTHWYTFYAYYDFNYSKAIKVENQDTILSNGITYKQAYRENAFYAGILPYLFGIREDVETGSLFINNEKAYYGAESSREILVSRMDLKEGDKFYFHQNVYLDDFEGIQTDETGFYTLVDSVYYKDNRKHIRCEAHYLPFFYRMYDIPLTFIEGIGPNISFDPFLDIGSYFAICFICYDTGLGLWKSDIEDISGRAIMQSGECLFNNSAIPDTKTHISLEIIKRKGEIELQLGIIPFEIVNIYTLQGRLVYTSLFSGKRNLIISTSDFQSGAYIISVEDINAKNSGRIVKKIIL